MGDEMINADESDLLLAKKENLRLQAELDRVKKQLSTPREQTEDQLGLVTQVQAILHERLRLRIRVSELETENAKLRRMLPKEG